MGGSSSALKNTIELDTFSKDSANTQKMIGDAFNKCIEDVPGEPAKFDEAKLSDSERKCLQEYIALYSHYCRGGYKKFMDLYNQHQQLMYEREMSGQGGGGGMPGQ